MRKGEKEVSTESTGRNKGPSNKSGCAGERVAGGGRAGLGESSLDLKQDVVGSQGSALIQGGVR